MWSDLCYLLHFAMQLQTFNLQQQETSTSRFHSNLLLMTRLPRLYPATHNSCRPKMAWQTSTPYQYKTEMVGVACLNACHGFQLGSVWLAAWALALPACNHDRCSC